MTNKVLVMSFIVGGGAVLPFVHSQDKAPLRLIRTIPMPNVEGRINNMALDIEHQRPYVAALANNTLEVPDLRAAKVCQTVTGLSEPQGLVYVPESGRLYVTIGGDGKCRVFSGDHLRQLSVVDVGEDADNIRHDPVAKRLYVGYGSGHQRDYARLD